MPFQEPVKVENAPEGPLGEIIKDVDRQGTDLTTFAEQHFTEAVDRGIAHVLIDYPTV
jgi:hypothetical protein